MFGTSLMKALVREDSPTKVDSLPKVLEEELKGINIVTSVIKDDEKMSSERNLPSDSNPSSK